MRIKTWKAWQDPVGGPHWTCRHKSEVVSSPCRIVPEATWRKVMAVVKAADSEVARYGAEYPTDFTKAVLALRTHERKRK